MIIKHIFRIVMTVLGIDTLSKSFIIIYVRRYLRR